MLENKVAIVTGSAKGLGKATAKLFAERKARVMLNDIDEETLWPTYKELLATGAKVLAIKADVTKLDEVNQMVEKVISEWGRVDILVNNAGGSLDTPQWMEELSEEDWNRVIDANLKGTFYCSRAVIPFMKKQKYGRIVNLASEAARTGSEVTGPHYAAAKGGVISFTRQLGRHMGPYGITVNAVAPGLFLSGPRVTGMWLTRRTEEERRQRMERIPLRRLGEPVDLAKVIAFLASDEASYVTGVIIDVNGGEFMG